MAIKELIPHISCICNEEDFEEAKARYSELYVYTTQGILKYVKLKYDRFIFIKVNSIPGQVSEIKEELNFLPAGKVPFILFKQIVAFFKKVIEVKKSSVEAHIHILWNPILSYYLAVPNQRVSAASVTYDFTHIGKDDVIVADFHSHNSMGAFWSGTDENDDKNKTYYTGVIGKLNLPKYEHVLRFNYNELKHKCELDDLFEITEEEVDVPDSWLEHIQTQTYGSRKNKHKDDKKQGRDSRFDPEDDSLYGDIPFGWGGVMADWQQMLEERENAPGKEHPPSNSQTQESTAGVERRERSSTEVRDFQEMRFNPQSGCMEPLDSQENQTQHSKTSSEMTPEPDPQYIKKTQVGSQIDPCYIDYLTAQYGDDAAQGYDQAAAGLMELDGCDEILLDLIREAYSRLTTNAQMELAQTGM